MNFQNNNTLFKGFFRNMISFQKIGFFHNIFSNIEINFLLEKNENLFSDI
jgi:hypothetical protein